MEKITKRKFAMIVIRQLKNNEWTFNWNRKAGSAPIATRKGKTLWCGNAGFFTDINNLNCFGYFWRHVVWWFGIKSKKKQFEKKYREELFKEIFSEEWWNEKTEIPGK